MNDELTFECPDCGAVVPVSRVAAIGKLTALRKPYFACTECVLRIQLDHVVADLGMRLTALREARDTALLLADALHALRNNAAHVADEFVERSLASLAEFEATLTPVTNPPEAG